LFNGNAAQGLYSEGGHDDDQFRDLMRMVRIILMALAVIAGLLASFLCMLHRGGPWMLLIALPRRSDHRDRCAASPGIANIE
jgi:hypothetical protein